MFGKLLKHEFHATGRAALPLCGGMLALAVLAGMVLRFWGEFETGWKGTAGSAIIILYGMSLFGVGVGVFVILMQRYKRNFFGDEGYLTRTLPVSEHELLFSKLLTAVCWYLAVMALMLLSVLIAGGIAGDVTWNNLLELADAAGYVLSRTGAGYVVEALLGTLGGMLLVTLLFYAVATIAQNFRKHRFLYFVAVWVILVLLIRLLGLVNGALTGALHLADRMAGTSAGIIGGADGPTAIYVSSGSSIWLIELYVSNALLYFVTWAFLRFRPNLE